MRSGFKYIEVRHGTDVDMIQITGGPLRLHLLRNQLIQVGPIFHDNSRSHSIFLYMSEMVMSGKSAVTNSASGER